MKDCQLIRLIEKCGYINGRGEHVYGTAALLHVLHCPVKHINPDLVKLGKEYVESLLSA